MEEQHTWLAYELRARNALRMRRVQEINELNKKEALKDNKKKEEIEMQQGLSYFRGEIINYRFYLCFQIFLKLFSLFCFLFLDVGKIAKRSILILLVMKDPLMQ